MQKHSSAALFWLAVAALPALAQPEAWRWQKEADSVALLKGGQIIWKGNFGKEETKPNFHPVALPGGPVLTLDKPADHRWHRALWFSWKFINGVNYWEEDPKTGLAAGRTEWANVRVETRPDFSARIEMDLTYRPAKGEAVMTERRVVEVSPPDREGVYYFDWTATFTAVTNLTLDRTPLPNEPGGKVFGGYAGLSVRCAANLNEVRAVTSDGPVTFANARYRGQSPALDYSGVIEGREVGVAILDDLRNLNAPSPWYVINDKVMRYFSPAVICFKPHTMKAGEQLTLRYRVLAHPGRWDGKRLGEESARFTRQGK